MNKLYLLAAALILAASIALFNQSPYAPIYSFEQYKADFSKQYEKKGEEEYRRIIYLQNLARITQHNADPYRTYNKGVNKFTDHTQFELETIYLTSIPSSASASILSNPLTTPLNVNVDWAAAGKVTPVINQGQCGSSWAFPATNALESVKLI
jgi:C1A family cysteine protease